MPDTDFKFLVLPTYVSIAMLSLQSIVGAFAGAFQKSEVAKLGSWINSSDPEMEILFQHSSIYFSLGFGFLQLPKGGLGW